MFETFIDYDSDVFTCNVTGDDNQNWAKTIMLDNYLTMSRNSLTPSSEDQVIAKVKFTLKDGVDSNTHKINFTKLNFVMDNDKSFNVSDKSVTIKTI